MFRKLVVATSATCALTIAVSGVLPESAAASPLGSSLINRGAFIFPNGDPNAVSYDGPGRDTMMQFSSFVSSTLYEVGSFTGQTGGSTLEAFMLSELAAFDGSTPGFANKFGVVNSSNTFSSMIDTAVSDPLATGSRAQAEAEQLTFAIQSPEGLFYSIDADNTDDGVAHMLALQVNTAGTVNLNQTDLQGSGPLAFNLQVGDIILFIEDMKKSGNVTNSLVPFASDFDYNDMVVVVRQSAVPEPTSMALAAIGLGGVVLRRRKKQQ